MPIHTCVCADEYMDRRYGLGRRVHNRMEGGGLRCAKCGKMAEAGKAAPKEREESKKKGG